MIKHKLLLIIRQLDLGLKILFLCKMKKYILLLSLMLLGLNIQSQILISLIFGDKLNSEGLEFGLEGGLNFSKISGLETNKYLHTLNLGFYFDIRLKNQWYLYTGVLVKSSMGVDQLSENDLNFLQTEVYPDEGDYSQKVNYFLVPVLAKYKFKNHIYVEGGPQFGLMYNAWVEFNSNVEGKDAKIKDYNKDMIQRLDMGIMAGAGYQLLKGKGLTIGLKYYYGFIDVYKDKTGTKNNSLFIKVNIPIGAEKKDGH